MDGKRAQEKMLNLISNRGMQIKTTRNFDYVLIRTAKEKIVKMGTSLTVQWLRLCLSMLDAWVWSLAGELRCHMPQCVAKIYWKNSENTRCCWVYELDLLYLAECKSLWRKKKVWKLLINTHVLYYLSNYFLDMYPKEMKTYFGTKTSIQMLLVLSFVITPNRTA